MVNEELISAAEAAQLLGVTMNNLRQIQHRQALTWVQKSGRNVFYFKADVLGYKAKRDARRSNG